MSHTMNIQIEMHDKAVLLSACMRLGITAIEGCHKLYNSTEKGLGISLKDWRFPVVVKADGSVSYDNYNGSWGHIDRFNELKSYYGLEKAKIEARKQGYSFYETANQDGDMQLKIRVEGI